MNMQNKIETSLEKKPFDLVLSGSHYLQVLKQFHQYLRPSTYLEIGTNTGSSLDFVECKTVAIDPNFILRTSATGKRPATLFFQTTSDAFFRKYDPKALLGDEIDLAFLDGLHDCLPTEESMLSRADNGAAWTGDVWKVVAILKEFRPDLEIRVYDAPPTGLVCCTNLDPGSTTIMDRYSEIWRKWAPIDLVSYGFQHYVDECDIRSTNDLRSPQEMRRYYWL